MAAGDAPEAETAGQSLLYTTSCSSTGGRTGRAGRNFWGGGGPGRGGRAGSGGGGAERVGRGGPVRSCYAALRTWRSYINTIRAVCVRSDGAYDQMLAEKSDYLSGKSEQFSGKKNMLPSVTSFSM